MSDSTRSGTGAGALPMPSITRSTIDEFAVEAMDLGEMLRRWPDNTNYQAQAQLRAALKQVDKDEVDAIVALLAGEEAYKWLSRAALSKVRQVGYFSAFNISPKLIHSFDGKLTPSQARGAAFECARLFEVAGFKTERNEKGYPLWRVS